MFLLMAQAQKQGIPENIRKLALSVHQIELSSKVIEEGQKNGTIKKEMLSLYQMRSGVVYKDHGTKSKLSGNSFTRS